jgi:FAD/FMN-containing dehydrogenase
MSDIAIIITASATALTGLVTAIGGIIIALRQKETITKVDDVHSMVNSQRTDMMTNLQELRAALQEAGITIPKDKSLEH